MQSGKKKKNKKELKAKVPSPPPAKLEDEAPSDFDFGGLPARDLKKNVGCG